MGGFAQRYHFEQMDIEDGLAQSQVTAITQDSKRRLWIATLGGISSFNGTLFTTYTKTDGLSSNFTLSLSTDHLNNVWIGTARGISKYNGQNFHYYLNTAGWADRIVSDQTGNRYATLSGRLFKINSSRIEPAKITSDREEKISALNTDYSGTLWAAVFRNGLHYLKNNTWQTFLLPESSRKLIITEILPDRFSKGKIWLLTTDGIYIAEKGSLTKNHSQIKGKLTSIAQDDTGNIWIGTDSGAFRITGTSIIHFNKANGFTDNQVNKIFKDIENNIWLATDGSGIFKFNDNSYETYDESQGLKNNIVMSMVDGPDPDEIWLGTYGGLFRLRNNQLKEINIPSVRHDSKRINCLLKDSRGNIWIGTPGGGLWMHNGKQIKRIDRENSRLSYNGLMEDSDKRIWLSTNAGCFILNHEDNSFIRITNRFGSSLMEIGKDSLISGTQEGAYLIDRLKYVKLINIKEIARSSILSMIKYKHFIIFGTSENGVLIWNRSNGKISGITTKQGLASDHIYSLLLDTKGILWVGTGKGISKLSTPDFRVIPSATVSLMTECNQKSILQYQNKIWIGTTRGVIVYPEEPISSPVRKPYIFINAVTILTKAEGISSGRDTIKTTSKNQELSKILELPYNQNNINIGFTGIYFTNPKAISYKYRLLGLDSKYNTTSNTSINYSSLPAGKYTFQVKAITSSGAVSVNAALFSFEIIPPYYQTSIFRLFLTLLVIFLILLMVYLILQLKERKRKLRLKIKLEEQFKIRKQTAEDFHDDLGNKLTRISVLSDVLLSMVDQKDTDKRNIIHKITGNVNELYSGTKDILWSLNPKNDNLSDLLFHIKDFGTELFNDTDIQFKHGVSLDKKDTKLSIQVSRNILMIFKEALHNALKHSKAKNISFSVTENGELLEIKLEDDGIGFDTSSAQNGHGINNINVRAKRIDAYLIVNSNDQGTAVNLYIKFSTLSNFKNI